MVSKMKIEKHFLSKIPLISSLLKHQTKFNTQFDDEREYISVIYDSKKRAFTSKLKARLNSIFFVLNVIISFAIEVVHAQDACYVDVKPVLVHLFLVE